VVVVCLLGLAGCGDFPSATDDSGPEPGVAPSVTQAADPSPTSAAPASELSATAAFSSHGKPVLFDDEFLVEEGVWYLADGADYPGLRGMYRGQVNGLLGAGAKRGVWVSGPALYGKYDVRIEAYPSEPRLPAWCGDAVEVSYTFQTGSITMGSFETWTDPMPLEPGAYRIRYCVAGHDVAAAETAEDEFDGDDYRLYSSRHLFQLWQAPAAPDEVLLEGSAFAQAENARVSDR
jgi:hypothetical protein